MVSTQAEEYVNDPSIEACWAIRAFENAQCHLSLICATNPKDLKLTNNDDELYSDFRSKFPDLKVDKLCESELKSSEAKSSWRLFAENYKDSVEDFNFGTLLRLDCAAKYDESNTTLVPRIQFLAIEIARNKEGLNSPLHQMFRPNDLYDESEASDNGGFKVASVDNR